MIKLISKKEKSSKEVMIKYDLRLFMKSNKEILTPVFAVSASAWKKFDLDTNSIHIGIDEESGKNFLVVVAGNEGRLLKAPKEGGSKKSTHFTYRQLSTLIAPNLAVGDSLPLFLNASTETVEGAIAVLEISNTSTEVPETGEVVETVDPAQTVMFGEAMAVGTASVQNTSTVENEEGENEGGISEEEEEDDL